MNIGGNDIPFMLIKVFSKKEYMEDFLNGILYLNESGYYAKLDDTFRGDKYDSSIMEQNATIMINNECFYPDVLVHGFVGDDKVPVFCVTALDQYSLNQIDDKTYTIKQEIIDELSKFGDYAILFDYTEFKLKLNNLCLIKNIRNVDSFVRYVDMYNPNKEYLKYCL